MKTLSRVGTTFSSVTVLVVAVVCFLGNWESQSDAADSPAPPAEETQIVLKATIIDIDSESMAKLGIALSDLMPDNRRAMQATETTKTAFQVASLTVGEGQLLVKLLRGIGAAKILAEPTIVSTAGRKASFHSGGQFLVPVPQANGGTIVETRKFGTFVDFTALKQSGGQLRIEIRVGHSEPDDSRTVTANGVKVPGLRSRWLDTAFMARSGQTVMFVGDQGLVFMVTPEVVDPNVSTPLTVESLPHSMPATANREPITVEAILYRADLKALHAKGIDLGKRLPSTTTSAYTTNIVSSVIGARQLSALVQRLADLDGVELIARPLLRIPSNMPARASAIGRIRVRETNGIQPASNEYQEVGVSIDLVPVALENGQIRLTASANVSRVTGDEKAIESQNLHGKGDLYTGESLVVYEEASSALLVVTPRRISSDPAGHRSPPQIVDARPKTQDVRPSARPTLNDEIHQLHDDVKVLRRDVSRLIEILEDRDSTSLKTVPAGDDHSSNNSADASFKEMWDVTLDEVIAIGIQNSKAIRELGGATSFGIDGKKEVVLSRVNKEVSLAVFEAAVRNYVSDTEDAYWELWAAQRNFDTAKKSRDAAQTSWNQIMERRRSASIAPEAEVQAREQYFYFRNQLEAALKELHSRERKLRSVCGVASSDSRLMRAADEPTTDKYIINWDDAKESALSNSAELHQQRRAVRQAEVGYQAAKTAFNRSLAAEAEVESTTLLYTSGKATLELVLDAQRRLAQSKIEYTSALAQYMTAIKDFHFHKGSLLAEHDLTIETAEEPVPAAQGTNESFAPPPAAIPDPTADFGAPETGCSWNPRSIRCSIANLPFLAFDNDSNFDRHRYSEVVAASTNSRNPCRSTDVPEVGNS